MNSVIFQGVGGELPQTFAACMNKVMLWGAKLTRKDFGIISIKDV